MVDRLLRTSERATFTKCRQQWYWAWIEGLRPKSQFPALRFGTLVHKALEIRYPPGTKRGPHPARTFEQLYELEVAEHGAYGFKDEDGNWYRAAEIGVHMLEAFVDKYGKDEDWEVISSEQTFRTRIKGNLVYVGTLDGIWRNRSTRHIMIVDWKTTEQFWFEHLPLDEQAGSYWAFAPRWLKQQGILPADAEIKGILYTFLRRAIPDDRPKNGLGQALNKDGTVSKRQPPPMFHRELVYRDKYERWLLRQRTIVQAREMRNCLDTPEMIYKSPGRMNCGACAFRDPCELHEAGRDYKPLLRGLYTKEDPYSAHNIEEDGKR